MHFLEICKKIKIEKMDLRIPGKIAGMKFVKVLGSRGGSLLKTSPATKKKFIFYKS